MKRAVPLLILVLDLLWSPSLLPAHGGAEEAVVGPSWPRWRGANGDGVSSEASWDPKALQGTARVLWKMDVGQGYSSASIRNNRLFTMGLKNRELNVFCLDAVSGRVIWKTSMKSIGVPQATPTIDGDRLYCLNQFGMLICLNASNGASVWKVDLAADLHAQRPSSGWAASPVAEGGLLLVNANSRQIALDKLTGHLLWECEDKVPIGSWGSYATPVVSDFGGVRCGVFLGPSTLIAVNLSTGKKLWSYPHKDYMHVVADPIVSGGNVLIALPEGSTLLRSEAGKPAVIWKTREFATWLPPPVLLDGYLYGSHIPPEDFISTWDRVHSVGLPLRCIDWKTGKVMWEKRMNYVSLTAAAGKLIMLELDGTLHVAAATSQTYKELAVTKVLAGRGGPPTFAAPPVLCSGRLYCRSLDGDLVCIDLRKAPAT